MEDLQVCESLTCRYGVPVFLMQAEGAIEHSNGTGAQQPSLRDNHQTSGVPLSPLPNFA